MFVVAGVTGHTGKVVAETLLAHGEKVRVIVRDAKQSEPWKSKGAEVAVVSLADAAALTQALSGAKGAYLLVPPRYDTDDGLAQQRTLVEAMAQAVRKSGVAHVVFLSSMGAELAEGTGPIRGLHHAEAAIGKAAKNLTIIRSGYFLENFAAVLPAAQNGVLPTFLTPGHAISMVATADVGRVAAESLLDPATGSRLIEVRPLRGLTPEDVARELSAVLGRTVTVQAGPLDGVVPAFTGMGIPKAVAELAREMFGAINSGRVKHQGPPAICRFGQLGPGDALRPLLSGAPSHV
jgi:uncharacterized protein YbjT (DUF2867 family)